MPRKTDESIEESIEESFKKGAKAGMVIALIAILSLSIYAIAVPTTIATITSILTVTNIVMASAAISLFTILSPLGFNSKESTILRFIGFMGTITLAAVAMVTALPVIGSVAPLVAPIILTVISASILTTMIVKHGRAPLQKNQQNQDHSGQKVQAKAPEIKISAQPSAAAIRSQALITKTKSAPVSSKQKETPQDSLAQPKTRKSI